MEGKQMLQHFRNFTSIESGQRTNFYIKEVWVRESLQVKSLPQGLLVLSKVENKYMEWGGGEV